MAVRLLTPVDAEAYVALRREMLADAPWAFSASVDDDVGLDAAYVASRLRDPGAWQAIIGAFAEDGRLLGAAGLIRERRIKMAHRARVWGVYVTPTARGRGNGRLAYHIMEAVIETARAWPGVTGVGLSVSENAAAAQRVYESLGFVAWGREPDAIRIGDRSFAEVHMYRAF